MRQKIYLFVAKETASIFEVLYEDGGMNKVSIQWICSVEQ